MAIVPNKDGQGIIANGFVGVVDVSYCVPTGSAAGSPAGSYTSLYTGEMRYDTTGNVMYRSMKGGTNNTWVAVH